MKEIGRIPLDKSGRLGHDRDRPRLRQDIPYQVQVLEGRQTARILFTVPGGVLVADAVPLPDVRGRAVVTVTVTLPAMSRARTDADPEGSPEMIPLPAVPVLAEAVVELPARNQ